MRFRQLHIENFGIFVDRALDFGEAPFQLIYGPNEAGKSTLLQLFREILFGFPDRSSPYQFGSHPGEMAAHAVIELADQRRVEFRRRKGRKNRVVGEFATTGEAIDEEALNRLLGNASLDLYQHVFGFSLQELSRGEDSLRHANLNEALFGGGLGSLSSLQQTQQELENEAAELFKPRGSTKTVNRLLKEIKDRNSEIKQATLRPREFEEQQKRLTEAKERVESLTESRDEIARRRNHLARLSDALEPWMELKHVREELAGLNVPEALTASSGQEFERLQADLEKAQRAVKESQEELAEIELELGNLNLEPELIEAEGAIRTLEKEVSRVQRDAEQAPKLETESSTLRKEADRLLQRLDPSWDLQFLESFHSTAEQLERLDKMEAARAELEKQSRELAIQRPDLEERVREDEQQLDELESVTVDDRLAELVERDGDYRSWLDRLKQQTEALHALQLELDRQRQELAPLLVGNNVENVDDERLAAMPVPLESTLKDFAERFQTAREAIRDAERRLDDCRQRVQAKRDELDREAAEGEVPDREQLEAIRRRRDTGWQLIRQQFLSEVVSGGRGGSEKAKLDEETPAREPKAPASSPDGGSAEPTSADTTSADAISADSTSTDTTSADATSAGISAARAPEQLHETIRDWLKEMRSSGSDPVSELPAAYEQAVISADELADERQLHAERVAVRDRLTLEITQLERDAEQCESVQEQKKRELDELQEEWVDVWNDCGIAPQTPEAMLEWRGLLMQWRQTRQDARETESRIDELQSGIDEFESRLEQAVVIPDSDPEETSPAQRLKFARSRIDESRSNERTRHKLAGRLPDLKRRHERLVEQSAQVASQQKEWDQQWASLLAELQLPSTCTVSSAGKLLRGIQAARDKHTEANDLKQRAAEVADEVSDFDQRVRELCESLDASLTELPPIDAITRLGERLSEATRAAQQHSVQKQHGEKARLRIAASEKDVSELSDRIGQLLAAAEASTPAEFLERAEKAARRAELVAESKRWLRELKRLADSEDFETFEAELREIEPEALERQLEEAKREHAVIESERDDAIEVKSEAEQTLRSMDGESHAAALQLELESSYARLGDAIDRLAPILLAQALLRRAVERFEREHQPAMLSEVGRLFSKMTLGRYSRIRRRLDEHGTMQVEQQDGELKTPEELSTGTREQLYLAIRLAYVRQYCRDSEPLPLIMDDILVNFDRERAEATLEVLFEQAEQLQVLFLTCHQHMADLVTSRHPDVVPLELAPV